MKSVICLVLLFSLSSTYAAADIAGNCPMAGFYLELGCTPVYSADNTTICPEAFDCPDARMNPDPSACYYRGAYYKPGVPFPESVIRNPCSRNCGCSVSNGVPYFGCAVVDCPEQGWPEGCIRTVSKLGACCSRNVCGKEAIARLKTCEFGGKIYKEGQLFYPENTRKTCLCTAQWSGRIDDPASCRELVTDCGVEIHYQDKIFSKCAPLFYGVQIGCPISFMCPNEKTKVIRGVNARGISSQCFYGNMTLSVGDQVVVKKPDSVSEDDRLSVEEECSKCVCDVPPYVSCTQVDSCHKEYIKRL